MRNTYTQNTTLTSTPNQLLLMLYDGAIRFCKLGIEGIESNNYELANTNLCKAQAIIYEFISSLDMKQPVSKDLLVMYEYIIHLLVQGNVKKDLILITEALGYIEELRETWAEASRLAGSMKPSNHYV
ncbi:hypothetical protein SY83_11020 [Paenibacillus swuensis]|uniref:Flagellar secretion chaperone FliS n=2 Tax=Paenibacillus swuensis TaxID=1178515 RepID=A0A172TPG3_9BACL|nr:hypothetical protein SY83_11020 [Paenibacillus swuensis]